MPSNASFPNSFTEQLLSDFLPYVSSRNALELPAETFGQTTPEHCLLTTAEPFVKQEP